MDPSSQCPSRPDGAPEPFIHEGTCRIDKRWILEHPIRFDSNGKIITVQVRKTEEKGSDVNLTAHLLVAAFKDAADAFFLLSNDSDFSDACGLLRTEAGKKIGLISSTDRLSKSLLTTSPDHVRTIRHGLRGASRLPDMRTDTHGRIRRPIA